MVTSPVSLTRWARQLARADGRGDGQLLRLFLHERDEAAIAELLRRHGPMVLGTCRRLLTNAHDAEDAFQAVFLVLLRKVPWGEQLGPWLYSVAVRTALHARGRRARARAVERQADAMTPEPVAPVSQSPEGTELLDAELSALPAKYREPLVLCELQGLSRRDAARRLRLAEGTLSSRLARGKEMLRRRLERRGVTVPAVIAPAIVPPALLKTTVRGVTLPAGAVSAGVLMLTEGVVKEMFLTKLKISVLMVPVLLTGMAIGTSTSRPVPAAAPDDPPVSRKEAAAPVQPAPFDPLMPHLTWVYNGPVDPVATIYGDIKLTRAEFAEFLIQRYGEKMVDLFVNKRIIEIACDRRGITLGPAEFDATFQEELKSIGCTEAEFVSNVLKRYGKGLTEWKEDELKPRLLLIKLGRCRVTVNDADLRHAFENQFGPKVHCRLILWPKGHEADSRRAAADIRANAAAFDRIARSQTSPTLAATGGEIAPIRRYSADPKKPQLECAAFQLRPGEVSDPIALPDGQTALLKCVERIPAETGRRFEAEKPRLYKEVLERKASGEIPALFAELKAEAKPQLYLRK